MVGDSLEEYYRARAPEYEQVYYRDDPARQAELSAESERLARLAAGKTVLELACGTGWWTKAMSADAARIVATDIAGETIALAREKTYGCEVEFLVADMFTHEFEREAFDLVVLRFWFSHHPRQDFAKLFDILTRPLRRGGLIWMMDNNPPAPGTGGLTHQTDKHGNNYKLRTLSNGQSYLVLKNYFSRNELEVILGERFDIRSLIHQPYYWSVVVAPKGT
ncbi:MAG: class I SAM-dependent methyltransferase [Candidatus Zixiibacteriota bacterium]